jgi:hypothetical protein
MKRVLGVALVALALLPALAIAQEGKAPEMDSATAAMLAEWEKYATPGPEHARMAKEVGNWDVLTRMWMDPSQPPTESKGSCVVTTILGGRFLRSDYKGDMMGMPFEGVAFSGYDNHKKEYVSTWMDNMGTMIMVFTGSCKADGSECTFTTSFDDPIMKTPKSVREVCRYTSADSWTMDWYETVPGQPERKTMEIIHTRVK